MALVVPGRPCDNDVLGNSQRLTLKEAMKGAADARSSPYSSRTAMPPYIGLADRAKACVLSSEAESDGSLRYAEPDKIADEGART